jgi:hypothetical protein
MANTYDIKIAEEDGIKYVWDGIRKKYVVCTPEEEVRQYTLKHFIENCNYPKGAINVEKLVQVGNKKLRYDIVVFVETSAWLLVECKQPKQKIDVDTLHQSMVYQNNLQAQFILLTNGDNMACYDVQAQKWLQELPEYPIADSL